MPEYMLLLHGGKFDHYTRQDMQEISGRYIGWMRNLAKEGRKVSGAPLADKSKVLEGKKVMDGPYAETKEVIGGYYLVEAANEEEALHLSQSCPHLDYGGTVELREVIKV